MNHSLKDGSINKHYPSDKSTEHCIYTDLTTLSRQAFVLRRGILNTTSSAPKPILHHYICPNGQNSVLPALNYWSLLPRTKYAHFFSRSLPFHTWPKPEGHMKQIKHVKTPGCHKLASLKKTLPFGGAWESCGLAATRQTNQWDIVQDRTRWKSLEVIRDIIYESPGKV